MFVHWLITSSPLIVRRPCIRFRHRLLYSTGPHGCIFIHVPKTAGTSVSTSLFGRAGPGHLSMRDYRDAYEPDVLARFFTFTFVRNPWDRLASAFFYLKSGGRTAEDARFARRHLTPFDSFESFVLNWVTPENVSRYWHFIPQSHFVCDEAGRSMVDFVGYYETLTADFAAVCRRLGVTRTLEHLNGTQRGREPYRSSYSAAMKDVVERVYGRDISAFGYDFASEGVLHREHRD